MRSYLPYIHNLRGLAILFVVGVHATGLQQDWKSHPIVDGVLENIFDPSEGNGTALFLFIGGFLFQYLTHQKFEFGKYIEQKFKVIIMPYLLISIPLILIRVSTNFESLALPDNFDDRSVFYQVVYFIVTGTHMPPFWFISTIILIYFTAPLLHAVDNDKFYKYVFPFILLSCFFTYRPLHNANPFLAYIHFVPLYLLGMWVSYYRNEILPSKAFFYFVILAYATISIFNFAGWTPLSRVLTFEYVVREGLFFFNIYILKSILLCLLLLMILYRLQHRPMPFIELLGNYSFGIFFVHYLFISVARKLLEMAAVTIEFSLPIYFASFVVLLGVSVLAVFVVKKITGRYSRYFIGS
jgi:probable poly-beta-1,6-N-acetyl-D-glucosamine export protein